MVVNAFQRNLLFAHDDHSCWLRFKRANNDSCNENGAWVMHIKLTTGEFILMVPLALRGLEVSNL